MAASGPEQYILDLPHLTALGRDDFLVTASNEAAVAAIERWPDWPNPVLVLCGPPASGKSHLGAVWQMMSGAARIDAMKLMRDAIPDLLSSGALLIEDAPSAALDEKALFHAINMAREIKGSILITAKEPPTAWQIALPDLASRLKAAGLTQLKTPDDELLRGLIVKQFADRQISVDERIVSYMLARMERSFEALRTLVAEIDRRALSEKAPVTRSFVSRILAQTTGEDPETD
jgi:chromosomal replication initiation ATPase DnaA